MAKKPNEIRLPVNVLLAATLCSGHEPMRSYLAGVYLRQEGKELRCVSTDGHRMLVISRELPKDVPEWLTNGVIVSNASLKDRLALMAKVSYDTATKFEDRMVIVSVHGDHLKLRDPADECVFRVPVVDGTFPDYQGVMAQITDSIFTGGLAANDEDVPGQDVPEGEAAEIIPMVGGPIPIGFRSEYVKSIAEVARLLGSEHVALRTSTPKNGAMITFPEADGAVLYVMPVETSDKVTAVNGKILALPLKRSLAALKAHVTRNKGWAKSTENPAERAEFLQRVEDFEGRIVTLIGQAPGLKALPAPDKEKAAPAKKAEVKRVKITPKAKKARKAKAKKARAKAVKSKKAANGAGRAPGKDRSEAKPAKKKPGQDRPTHTVTTTPASGQKAAA